MAAIYDSIGIDYADLRRPDPRIASAVHAALGSAKSVLNVGAGTGSYEPRHLDVTALEPSREMIGQRSASAAPALRGHAENLPFPDNQFDASMAVLTVHHWTDKARGLREMRRVTRGPVVLLTFDPACRGSWLTDHLPELVTLDEEQMPAMSDYKMWLGPVEVTPVPIPHDCTDGFLYAFWRQPAAYLDKRIRSGSSSFWAIDGVDAALARLADDLESGAWARRYADVVAREELDAGYRLVVSR
ncbi:MAG: class I SAM-dependent methyltransferase [Pacificimonas sp.]